MSDIPNQILEQLNEQTGGGFLLFYIDQNGDICYLPYCDSSAGMSGLMSHAKAISIAYENHILTQAIAGFNEEDG